MGSFLPLGEALKVSQLSENTVNHSLTDQERHFITSLSHPNLVDDEKPDLAAQFDTFSQFQLSKPALDSHDLWCVMNQLLKVLKVLASNGLNHKRLNLHNVVVSSINPI
ncbi:hypothetical protein RCL1_002975 [Eukaryota sp. TZLM3-RCL]